jgi:hypothetical protein
MASRNCSLGKATYPANLDLKKEHGIFIRLIIHDWEDIIKIDICLPLNDNSS